MNVDKAIRDRRCVCETHPRQQYAAGRTAAIGETREGRMRALGQCPWSTSQKTCTVMSRNSGRMLLAMIQVRQGFALFWTPAVPKGRNGGFLSPGCQRIPDIHLQKGEEWYVK